MDTRLDIPTRAMRIALGVMATLAGLDKFFNILADWGSYVSPAAAHLLPVSPDVLMGIVGVVEVAVGIAILTALPVLGVYVASAWLLLLAVNLAAAGYFDIAVRDVVCPSPRSLWPGSLRFATGSRYRKRHATSPWATRRSPAMRPSAIVALASRPGMLCTSPRGSVIGPGRPTAG